MPPQTSPPPSPLSPSTPWTGAQQRSVFPCDSRGESASCWWDCAAGPQGSPAGLERARRSLRTCLPATRGLTTRVAREDRPPRRAGPGSRWRRWRGRRGRRGRGRGRERGERGAARPSFRWPRGGRASAMTLRGVTVVR